MRTTRGQASVVIRVSGMVEIFVDEFIEIAPEVGKGACDDSIQRIGDFGDEGATLLVLVGGDVSTAVGDFGSDVVDDGGSGVGVGDDEAIVGGG